MQDVATGGENFRLGSTCHDGTEQTCYVACDLLAIVEHDQDVASGKFPSDGGGRIVAAGDVGAYRRRNRLQGGVTGSRGGEVDERDAARMTAGACACGRYGNARLTDAACAHDRDDLLALDEIAERRQVLLAPDEPRRRIR